MKILSVSHKPTETTQFFQDHGHSPHLWWSRCNWWLGVTGRSPEVKWGRNPVFANNSRHDGDRDTQMIWLDFDLSRSKSTCFEPIRRGKHDGVTFIFVSVISKKQSMKNHLREKRQFFIWWPVEPKLLSLRQIWSENGAMASRQISNVFLILPSYHTLGVNSRCLWKNIYFLKTWSLVTSGDPNIDLTWT